MTDLPEGNTFVVSQPPPAPFPLKPCFQDVEKVSHRVRRLSNDREVVWMYGKRQRARVTAGRPARIPDR